MSILTIILFFIYLWGFGYSITRFFHNAENVFERNLMRIGIGLGIFPVLGALLNVVRTPLDWKIFLVLSLIIPLFDLFKRIRNKQYSSFSLKLTKTNLSTLLVFIIFIITLFMYVKGSFIYPYFEDDDPWSQAAAIKYVAMEKTTFSDYHFSNYIDPYPPAYSIILGVLHQTSPDLMWTIKFFNALIISLGIIFFYFFVKEFTNDKNKALFATFVLMAIPSYLSHFIWSHALIVTLYFPSLYALEMIKYDKKWAYIAMFPIAAILITQPTQAIKFGVIFSIYFLIKSIINKKFQLSLFLAGLYGFILSFLWWAPMILKYGSIPAVLGGQGGMEYISQAKGTESLLSGLRQFFDPAGGSATRVYSFSDFVWAQKTNMINNPIGWGLVISLLLLLGLIYIIIKYRDLLQKEHNWKLITVFWFVFTFLGVNSLTFNLPIGLFAFRFWMLLAIPVSILTAEGLWFLFSLNKQASIKPVILIIIIVGILLTSFYQKYTVNTAVWSPGQGWNSFEEIQGYTWMKDNLPKNTLVFTACIDDSHVIAYDMFSCIWCKDVEDYRKGFLNKSIEDITPWLKSKNYEYLLLDTWCAVNYGINETNTKINDLINSKKYTPIHQTPGAIILKII